MDKLLIFSFTCLALGGALLGLSTYPQATPIGEKIVELHTTYNKPQTEESKSKKGLRLLPFQKSICSGAFIDDQGDILTARHCTEGSSEIEVQTSDNQTYKAVLVAESRLHDLAIVQIDRLNTPYFRLASSITRGETMFTRGSPLGITDTLSKGIIAKIAGDAVLVDCSFLPGNSGGPVFNEKEELIGVVTAVFVVNMGLTHLGMAQSLNAVHSFLRDLHIKGYEHD